LASVREPRVVIVGGGVCGLIAAQLLTDAGLSPTVVDKASRPGGRLASRRIADQIINTGPQSLKFGTTSSLAAVQRYSSGELVPDGERDDESFAFRTSAADLSLALAEGIDYRTGLVTHLQRTPGGKVALGLWGNPSGMDADAVVLTPPTPQVANLLAASGFDVPGWVSRIGYEKRLVLITQTNGDIKASGSDSPIFEYWSDDDDAVGAKGVLASFASASWSEANWTQDAVATESTMLRELARLYPGSRTTSAQVKRWRYANATNPAQAPTAGKLEGLPIWIAGDGYGASTGRRFGVERSILSAIAVAEGVLTSV
jgi:renalase